MLSMQSMIQLEKQEHNNYWPTANVKVLAVEIVKAAESSLYCQTAEQELLEGRRGHRFRFQVHPVQELFLANDYYTEIMWELGSVSTPYMAIQQNYVNHLAQWI